MGLERRLQCLLCQKTVQCETQLHLRAWLQPCTPRDTELCSLTIWSAQGILGARAELQRSWGHGRAGDAFPCLLRAGQSNCPSLDYFCLCWVIPSSARSPQAGLTGCSPPAAHSSHELAASPLSPCSWPERQHLPRQVTPRWGMVPSHICPASPGPTPDHARQDTEAASGHG